MIPKTFGFCALFTLLNVGFTIWRAYYTLSQLFVSKHPHEQKHEQEHEYTYVGDYYPLYYPTGPLDTVAMTLYDSVHFSLFPLPESAFYSFETPASPYNVSDSHSDPKSYNNSFSLPATSRASLADKQYAILARIPLNFGRTHLGSLEVPYRLFVITVYHQMHCLRKIQVALLDREDKISNYHHVEHCLNYLRQTLLCAANGGVEKGDWLRGRGYYLEERDLHELVGGEDLEKGEVGVKEGLVGDTLVCEDWERVYDLLDENYWDWRKWQAQWD